MVSKVQLNEAIGNSGTRYAATCLAMPMTMIHDSIQHLNVVMGLRGREIQGVIDESGNYKPYKTPWSPGDANEIKANVLETFHLQYEAEFDPEPLFKTIYSKPIDKIPMVTQAMVKKICVAKMAAISENLNPCIWQGERDEDATDTLSNFDGFATIIRKERTAGNISLSAGNLAQLGGINKYNAGDKLQLIWDRRDRKIRKADMFIEDKILTMYNKWYRNQNYNNANTDTDGEQKFLIGTEKRCRLVSCTGMEGMGYIILTDGKKNMRVGIDGIGTGEDATGDFILRTGNNVKTVQMFTDCWMGVNFTSIDKRYFMTASYNLHDESVYATVDPEEKTITTTAGTAKTVTVNFQGYNLTSSVAVNVSGTGFSVDTATITAVQANAEGGKNVIVTFTSAQAVTNAVGLVRFVSATDDIDLTVKITASATA